MAATARAVDLSDVKEGGGAFKPRRKPEGDYRAKFVKADDHIKGQRAASSYKSAKLENGLRVQVPPVIGAGERIVVSTDEIAYVKRAD